MSVPDVTNAVLQWPFLPTLGRLALALGTGAFRTGTRTSHPIDPYGLVQLRETWATVLLIAALEFVNYVLWKIYGPRSIDITSFLGGLVNRTAAVAELSSRVREVGESFVKLASIRSASLAD
jgi:Domain of unknown function (DUF4010)